jgi:hypothetical protein
MADVGLLASCGLADLGLDDIPDSDLAAVEGRVISVFIRGFKDRSQGRGPNCSAAPGG